MRLELPALPVLAGSCALLLSGIYGCRDEVPVPAFSPAQAAKRAFQDYDKNGDKLLDKQELKAAPGIAAIRESADKDGDGKLSETEFRQRIAQFIQDNVAYLPVRLQVFFDGQPLDDAEVELIPEPCFGDLLTAAGGHTNAEGIVAPLTERQELGGVQCGLYRIAITKQDGSKKNLVPAQYNQETNLGLEVSLQNRELERTVILRLSSRSP